MVPLDPRANPSLARYLQASVPLPVCLTLLLRDCPLLLLADWRYHPPLPHQRPCQTLLPPAQP